jgi:hypothetical protein
MRTDIHHGRQVDAAEDDAGIGRSRTQCQIDFLARVQTHARCPDYVFESALSDHEPIPKDPMY